MTEPQLISISLINLQMASQSDAAGVLALRKKFGDDVVTIVHTELPHLAQTLAITAHQEGKSPKEFVKALRRSIDTMMTVDSANVATSDDADEIATHLIRLIDPTHEDEARRSLHDLLSSQLEQILEDQQAFAR